MFVDIKKMRDIETIQSFDAMIYTAAMEYASQGLLVIPLRPNEKILPRKNSGVNYFSASSNEKTVGKWFDPHEGKYRGWNIGIVTGVTGGVFVVDADIKGKIDGNHQLDGLQEQYTEFDPHPTQETPGGGQHHVFQWQMGCSSSTSKLDTGIDTRGGSEDKPGGHIVAFPSTVDGRMYRWVDGGEIPDAPAWLLTMMGVSSAMLSATAGRNTSAFTAAVPPVSTGATRGSENVTDDDVEEIMAEEDIQALLNSIDIESISYNEWLWVGQAINTQYPDVEGLELWGQWSKTGTRYKKGECSIRWNGFDPAGDIRISTLYYLAKQHGHKVETNSMDQEVIDTINKDHAIVLVGNKIRILKECDNGPEDWWKQSYDLISKDDFKTIFENRVVPGLTPTGRPVEKTWAEIWLASEDRREYPRGVGFYPGLETPVGVYNTWRGWPIKPGAGDCSAFLDHIHEVLCAGNKKLSDFVLDWLADIFQSPEKPKGTAIVMRGREGAGKGSMYQCISPLIGPHATQLIDESHLTSNFNAHLIDTLLLFADEITWGGNKRSAGKLKGLVTEQFITGERKGIDAIKYRNFMRMMVSSNDDWVIPAGTNSRRWLVLDILDKRVGDMAYFDHLFKSTKANLPALMGFLLNRSVDTNALRLAPVTEALHDQRMLSTESIDPVMTWWKNKLEDGDMGQIPNEGVVDLDSPDYWPTLVVRSDTYDDYFEWCTRSRSRVIGKAAFYKKMELYGFERTRAGKPDGKGIRRHMYEVPELPKALHFFNLIHKSET